MRISTAQFHQQALDSLLNQQSAVSRTQNQIATGSRIQTPADDPIGAAHLLELNRSLAQSDQFSKNTDATTARLNNAEQSLSDSGVILQRVRELVVQANSAALTDTDRTAIATELQQRAQELLDVANSRDGNGEFLFSGYATTTQPFSRVGGSVVYAGDQGSRSQQVGPTQRIVDSNSGFDVFVNIPQGNGTFVTAATASNTGTGSIDTGAVLTPAAWVPDTYTITFVAPDSYQITNSAATVVVPAVAGNYKTGNAIAFNGVQVAVSGVPATGDAFTVASSQKEDIFTSIDKIVAALQPTTGGSLPRAQIATKLGAALQQLDQADTHMQNVQSSIGARLSMLDDAKSTQQNMSVDLQTAISNLRDVDFAQAVSTMNRQLIGLQAAQQSFAKLAQLSLFNFL